MLDAFAAAYPARWSWPAKLLLPAVHPMTLVRAIHLGLMFPLGIASFVFLVVTLTVGGSLIWTLIGPIVLLVGLYVSRWFGDLEAWRVRHVAGIELRRPPTGIERGQSFRQQVWTRLIDPSTWTGLVYLLVQFPIGIAAFVLLVVGGSVAGAFVAAPFYSTYLENSDGSEAISVMIDLGFWSTSLTETSDIAIALVPVGILVYFLLVHAINIATAVHASWARLMLGSRAEPIALGPADSPPPPAPSDDPPPPSRPRRHYRTRRARVPERSTAIQWRPPSRSSPMCRRRRRPYRHPNPPNQRQTRRHRGPGRPRTSRRSRSPRPRNQEQRRRVCSNRRRARISLPCVSIRRRLRPTSRSRTSSSRNWTRRCSWRLTSRSTPSPRASARC